MKWVVILFLFSCSQTSDIKINLYAKKVMDIELPSKNVLPYCSIPGDPEKKNSWLGVYVFHGDKIERLSVRHQQTPGECEKDKKEMEKILSKSVNVRVIGVESGNRFEDTDLIKIMKKPPKKITAQWWRFSRIITDKGCFGWEGCEEPKLVEKENYSNIYE